MRSAVRSALEIVPEALFRLSRGPRYIATAVRDALLDASNDRRFGISSSKRRGRLNVERDGDRGEYTPSSYFDVPELMELIPPAARHGVFVDLGSGMGRVLCLAATYPFRTVIGVELSADLNEVAQQNVERMRGRAACEDIRVVTADVTGYEIPADANVLFFFNPFNGAIFEAAVANVARSLRANPRDVTVVWSGPGTERRSPQLLDTCGWLVRRDAVMLPTGRVGAVYANTCWTAHAARLVAQTADV